jgi:Helix-turn-helix domain
MTENEKVDRTAVSRVFGQQVKAVRESLQPRVTQSKLAKRLKDLGVPMGQVTIARIENGERRVTVDDALALAAALGVNPKNLLSGIYAHEPVPVTPKLKLTPSHMLWWFEGTRPPPGTDERTYFELIPDEELIARQRRGLHHLKESVLHFVRAAAAKDVREMRYALRLIETELQRQREGLDLEERRARRED